ncbi:MULTISPECIES: Fic family protein [Dyella]|uniref:Fic family protein n=2 Tax=Dyella TaxID=231454 RepID=A0A4R0YL66_9GAMM|nr:MULTISPECIES: Fic family protein [Dyella]TBR36721.1 Fic family protein [Dyella terrae]TCI08188.1 Fic family protein [Dyella soli]
MIRGQGEILSTQGEWSTELIRLGGDRILGSTIPGCISSRVLRHLAAVSAGLKVQSAVAARYAQAVLVVPACGSRIANELLSESSYGNASYSPLETMTTGLADFSRAIRLPISASHRVDLGKLASQFRSNKFRKKESVVRVGAVVVEGLEGQLAYVPPHPKHFDRLLGDLYEAIRSLEPKSMDAVAPVAFLIMCQFMAIHPLTDGNGRAARAMFIRLCRIGGLDAASAALILSIVLTRYRAAYYSSLMSYCLSGDFSGLEAILLSSIRDANAAVAVTSSEDDFRSEVSVRKGEGRPALQGQAALAEFVELAKIIY